MIPGYNDSTAPTITGDYDPFAVRYEPNRYSNATSATTLTIDPWQTNSTAASWDVIPIPASPRTEREESEDLKAFKKAVARSLLLADQRALRTLRDDPSPRIPLQARKGLSGRQAARKRVCAGSSRYRVLVN